MLCAVTSSADEGSAAGASPAYEKPLFDLRQFFKTPVKIESIELLKNGGHYFVRSRSTDGVVGVSRTKQIRHYIPILLELVMPHFIGKDARDLETLVDAVYVRNYKIAGQPFWCRVPEKSLVSAGLDSDFLLPEGYP